MPIIEERNIIKKIPIYCKAGRNRGKQTGFVYFERNKEPYYYITKNFKSNQMMRSPVHIGELPISTSTLKELNDYGCKSVIFMIIGFDEHCFYIIVPLKDYNNAKGYNFDDPQKYVHINDYSRIYPEQGSLMKFVGV